MCNISEICFRCFLATESVKGMRWPCLTIENNGSILEAGYF